MCLSYKYHDRQVANLEDVISERGACGVGFIAHLENKASYEIVKDALTALGCMEHRGGCGADNDSGDGSGLMTSIPWDLFNNWAENEGIASFDKFHTGVGMVFFPKDDDLMKKAKEGDCSFYLIFFPCDCIDRVCTNCYLRQKKFCFSQFCIIFYLLLLI